MIWLPIGRREEGKSTLALYLSDRSGADLLIVFDPRGLFPAERRCLTTHAVTTELDIAHAMTEDDTTRGQKYRIVVTPRQSLQAGFDRCCEGVIEYLDVTKRPATFIVDEAAMVDLRTSDFGWLTRCVARQDLTIICTTHRPVDVPVSVRAIADYWCVFPVTQKHDLDALADRCSDPAMRDIARLQHRQFVLWDDTKGAHALYADPSLWFVSLGRAEPRVARPPILPDAPPREKRLLFEE